MVALGILTVPWLGRVGPLPRLKPRRINGCRPCRRRICLSLTAKLQVVTIPFGDPEPSDQIFDRPVQTERLRLWLHGRLRLLARDQRIQDARALRSEFSLE